MIVQLQAARENGRSCTARRAVEGGGLSRRRRGAASSPRYALIGTWFGALPTVVACSSDPVLQRCNFEIETTMSELVPTVATVRWRLRDVRPTSATLLVQRIGGGARRADPLTIDTDREVQQSWLWGLKASSKYTYQVSVNDGECISSAREVVTGPAPTAVPTSIFEQGQRLTPGFYILCTGFGPAAGSGDSPQSKVVHIIDEDGDPVWWWSAPQAVSRATLDWQGSYVYMLAINVNESEGGMYRVRLDGEDAEEIVELSTGHHDFTATPHGLAVIVHRGEGDAVVAYDPVTNAVTDVADVSNLYAMVDPGYHANSISYIKEDDTLILGDRYANLFVKLDRQGRLLWQFGGENPRGAAFEGVEGWRANHGHHWTGDKMFVFSNQAAGGSPILEFDVDEANSRAELVRTIAVNGYSSLVLGDVQRLPNHHVLATYSVPGRLVEYSPSGEVLAVVQFRRSLGYTMYRDSLFGPPYK
jgi:hypothetical protein